MHELSVATDIVEATLTELRRPNATCAKRIRVRVGELSGLNPENLRFCLEALQDGTPLGELEIDVERVRAGLLCPACGEVECSDRFVLLCPSCAGPISGLVGGREIEVALECEETGEEPSLAD